MNGQTVNQAAIYNVQSMEDVSYTTKDYRRVNNMTKRIIDLALVMPMVILLIPLFMLISICIKVNSAGPVFYRQQRVGYEGALFQIYKFRTMIEGADNHIPVLYGKLAKDERITGIGRVLRKLSLDELPQLVNILKGDMSLVGPRPFIEIENNGLTEEQLKRLNAVPGITGLAQINGRSDLPIDKLVQYDLKYINSYSTWLDIVILLRTIPYVLLSKGAY